MCTRKCMLVHLSAAVRLEFTYPDPCSSLETLDTCRVGGPLRGIFDRYAYTCTPPETCTPHHYRSSTPSLWAAAAGAYPVLSYCSGAHSVLLQTASPMPPVLPTVVAAPVALNVGLGIEHTPCHCGRPPGRTRNTCPCRSPVT